MAGSRGGGCLTLRPGRRPLAGRVLPVHTLPAPAGSGTERWWPGGRGESKRVPAAPGTRASYSATLSALLDSGSSWLLVPGWEGAGRWFSEAPSQGAEVSYKCKSTARTRGKMLCFQLHPGTPVLQPRHP